MARRKITLHPASYYLRKPYHTVTIEFCLRFNNKAPGNFWYVYGCHPEPYFREGEGFFESTPTQFKTARAAAKAYIAWVEEQKKEQP